MEEFSSSPPSSHSFAKSLSYDRNDDYALCTRYRDTKRHVVREQNATGLFFLRNNGPELGFACVGVNDELVIEVRISEERVTSPMIRFISSTASCSTVVHANSLFLDVSFVRGARECVLVDQKFEAQHVFFVGTKFREKNDDDARNFALIGGRLLLWMSSTLREDGRIGQGRVATRETMGGNGGQGVKEEGQMEEEEEVRAKVGCSRDSETTTRTTATSLASRTSANFSKILEKRLARIFSKSAKTSWTQK